MELHKRLPPLLLLLLLSPASHAIVTMESLHTLKPTAGFTGQLDLSLNGSAGSTDQKEYGFATRLQWHQPQRYTNFLLVDGSYAEVNGVKNTEKGFIHARHIQPVTQTLESELFAQAEQNRFARLTLRTLAGGGARLTLLDHPQRGLVLAGLGAFWSREEIDNVYPDAGSEIRWRANSYLVAKYRFSPTAQLSNTLYYQPAFEEAGDYRLVEQLGLTVSMNDTVSLTLALDHTYDSRPPIGVDRAQTSYQSSLGISF